MCLKPEEDLTTGRNVVFLFLGTPSFVVYYLKTELKNIFFQKYNFIFPNFWKALLVDFLDKKHFIKTI